MIRLLSVFLFLVVLTTGCGGMPTTSGNTTTSAAPPNKPDLSIVVATVESSTSVPLTCFSYMCNGQVTGQFFYVELSVTNNTGSPIGFPLGGITILYTIGLPGGEQHTLDYANSLFLNQTTGSSGQQVAYLTLFPHQSKMVLVDFPVLNPNTDNTIEPKVLISTGAGKYHNATYSAPLPSWYQ